MLTQKMQDALNAQIQAESYSAWLYLAMAAHAEQANFKGMAQWLRAQHQEELSHAYKLFDYVHDRGGKVTLKTLEAPPAEFGAPLALFEQVYRHEQHVTSLIHKLYELAVAEKDVATQVFLSWYVNEQVEEEANASEIVEKLKLIGEKSGGIWYLDKELGKRGKS
jgi:ferritin